jgi:putative transposase
MVYIDLNMLRAGVVMHPRDWLMGGYREIQNPPARYAVIDQAALLDVLGFRDLGQLQQACREWVEEGLRPTQQIRDGTWSESLAVGRKEFVEAIKSELGLRGVYRESVETEIAHALREPATAYQGVT